MAGADPKASYPELAYGKRRRRFNAPFFQEGASWGKLNKVFDGNLEAIIHDINAAIAA